MSIRPVDRGEKAVHFGCGAVVGFLAGLASLAYSESILTAAVSAIVFGALAAIFGERFWHALGRWGSW
jgi:hypothetical protein